MRALLFFLVILVTQTGTSHPVLGEGRVTPVGRCYPDHEERGLWWLAPQSVDLMREDGRPVAVYTTFLYQGARGTGDAGRQWGGSVLQFTLDFESVSGRVAQAQSFLGPNRRVRILEPSEIRADVVFAGVQAGGREAGPGERDGPGGVAKQSSFSLALSPEEGEAVRSAWESGVVILSVNVVASAFAYQTRPDRNDDEPPELVPVLVDVVNVNLDPQDEGLFRVLSLDATMPADYTSLDIGCSEMTTGQSFSDIARVVVVVTGEAVNGDRIDEQVRFTNRSAPIQTVRFRQALKLDAGYEVKTLKIYTSGNLEDVNTRQVGVWQGFVDVCSTRAGTVNELDPRLLY